MSFDSDQSNEEMDAKDAIESQSTRISVNALVASHYADVYRFAYRLSGSTADAEDLTQQTFLIACRKVHQIQDLSKGRAWLFTIVRNAYLKNRQRETIELSAFAGAVVAVDDSTEMNLDFDEEALEIALGKMPEAYRTPTLLFYFEDIGYKEIAEILDLPIGTVMSRLSRGKSFLRSQLADARTSTESSVTNQIESTD